MFTGLIGAIGTVVERTHAPIHSVWISTSFDDLAHGESVACAGICLTVAKRRSEPNGEHGFLIQAGPETLARTTLGSWKAGERVNLERALRPLDRMGGHFVQGHIDGVGTIRAISRDGATARIVVAHPPEMASLFVEKGSVAMDGVSLTVAAVAADALEVMLIPETLAATTLGSALVGARVNLEGDVLGKYVARHRSFENHQTIPKSCMEGPE